MSTTIDPVTTPAPTNTFLNSAGNAPNVNADGTSTPEDPQTEFLSLLVTQLQNQDPDSPVDETTMLSQLAQFSSLSAMTTLNSTMTASTAISNLSQSASLIGKTVTLTDPSSGTTTSGNVNSVNVVNGSAMLSVGGQNYPLTNVTAVQ